MFGNRVCFQNSLHISRVVLHSSLQQINDIRCERQLVPANFSFFKSYLTYWALTELSVYTVPHCSSQVTKHFTDDGKGTTFCMGGGGNLRLLKFPAQYLLVLLLKGVWRQCVSVCVKNVRPWEGKFLNTKGSGIGQFGGMHYDEIFVMLRRQSLGWNFEIWVRTTPWGTFNFI
jgi:hypothetical protein